MGLLDEAIRDHLELKRRRGADPGEVAREEREALESLDAPDGKDTAAEPIHAELLHEDDGPEYGDVGGEPLDAEVSDTQRDHEPADASEPGQASEAIQETAELDMATVMDAPEADDPGTAPLGTHEADESLEWEMPGKVQTERAPDHPEGESDAFEPFDHASEDAFHHAAGPTPVSPDQERLSFERRAQGDAVSDA